MKQLRTTPTCAPYCSAWSCTALWFTWVDGCETNNKDVTCINLCVSF